MFLHVYNIFFLFQVLTVVVGRFTFPQLARFNKDPGEDFEEPDPDDELKDNDEVIVGNTDYIEELMKLLDTNVTPLRVQMAYIMWRTITDLYEYLHDDVRELFFKLVGKLSGQTEVCQIV